MLLSYETDQEFGSIDTLMGGGIDGPLRVLGEDVWALDRQGLVQGQWNTDGTARFTVTAEGFAYYEKLRQRASDAAGAVEQEVKRHLEGAEFKKSFPAAYDRITAAEDMLWQARPQDDFTTIGHKLREALQQFATAMVERHQPTDVEPDPAKTKNRLRSVLNLHRARIGDRKADLLDALLAYHDAVNGMVQRQEHGDQKADDPLTWEDARTAVFQTLNLIFEFDRLLNA